MQQENRGVGRKALNKKQIATRVSPSTLDRLQQFCKDTGRVKAVVIEEAIEAYVAARSVGLRGANTTSTAQKQPQ